MNWDFMIFLVISLLFFPIYLVVNWVLAAILHEVSHIIVLYVFKIRVFEIRIRSSGTYMETDAMTPKQEILCAMAGPLGGFLGGVLYRINPYFAICSILQSVINLLPIYPADGGRVINGLLCLKFREKTANDISNCVSIIVVLFIIVGGYVFAVHHGYSLRTMHIVSCVLTVVLLKNSLQRDGKDSTM